MAYGTPADPVGGTVITVAYAVANIMDPIRWLRLLTGNADPPGSSYVVVSDSTTATTWKKVPADALAAGVAVANLGYTPVNRAGDTAMTGAFTTTGVITGLGLAAGATGITSAGTIATSSGASITAAGGVQAGGNMFATGSMTAGSYVGGSTSSGSPSVLGLSVGASGIANGGPYTGGSTSSGSPSVLGLSVGASGIASAGPIATSGSASITSANDITATDLVTAGRYAGGSTAQGSPSFLGLSVGTSGIATTGPIDTDSTINADGSITAGSYEGGSQLAGTPEFFAVSIGTGGLVNNGAYTGGSTAAGTPSVLGMFVGTSGIDSAGPIAVGGNIVYHPGNPPPLGSGAAVPAGLIAAFETAAAIASGWTRYTAMDGRMPIGAGSASGITGSWAEATNFGTSWAHKHISNSWSASFTGSGSGSGSATGGPSDATGASATTLNGRFTAGGANALPDSHTHPLNGVSLAVSVSVSVTGSGTAGGDTTDASWTIPSRSLVYAQKS